MTLLFASLVSGAATNAQQDPMEGLWQGFDGEWLHVSRQLVALAEAIPADKFAWRPAPGVRSTSEVINHITLANFFLLAFTGPKLPADLKAEGMEKGLTNKAEVIAWLKRSQMRSGPPTPESSRPPFRARSGSKAGKLRWTASICASSCTPTNTWANWWPMRE